MRYLILWSTLLIAGCEGGNTVGACELDEFPGTCLNWQTRKACNYMGDNAFSADIDCLDIGYVECPIDTERELEVGDGTHLALVDDEASCDPTN